MVDQMVFMKQSIDFYIIVSQIYKLSVNNNTLRFL